MAVTVKKIALWRGEVENKPGVLAKVLAPLAAAGADLQVVIGYPGNESKAAIEVFPITGKRSLAGASAAGLAASSIPTLRIEGDNKPGLGHAITQALADAGIDLGFLVAQVVGKRYSAIIGFESEADAAKAGALIKKATVSKRK